MSVVKLLKSKVLNLENKLSQSEAHINSLDQYNRRNNFETQGIPSDVSDDALEDKVVDIFHSLNINVSKHDIEIAIVWERQIQRTQLFHFLIVNFAMKL